MTPTATSVDIASLARINVLIVPVGPIKRSVFASHVQLISQFHQIALADLTPELVHGNSPMFSSQGFQEGRMHFRFLTSFNDVNQHLEDFQLHRRLFGVIGIMDCREWKSDQIASSYQMFKTKLEQYPSALATRLFAFDPQENQPDDTKGVIMIPDVGNQSFYMNTMILDFASQFLGGFGILASAIERKPHIESPQLFNMPNADIATPPSAMASNDIPVPRPVAPSPVLDATKSPTSGDFSKPPPEPALVNDSAPGAPSPTSSISSTFLKRASTVTSPTPNRQGPQAQNLPGRERSPRPPSISRTHSGSSLSPNPTPSMSMAMLSSESSKLKRRAPGRIQKLLGDLFLLAGRLPDAVNTYNKAIDFARSNSDYLWLAAAMEGLLCANLLLDALRADQEGVVERDTESSTDATSGGPDPSSMKQPKSFHVEVQERYFLILGYYTKTSSTTIPPTPTVIYVEACLKVAKFLTTIYFCNGWNKEAMECLQAGNMTPSSHYVDGDQSYLWTEPRLNLDDMIAHKASGLSRFEIGQWVMRAWGTHLQDLDPTEQIRLVTAMATILAHIGYRRKYAFLLRQTLQISLPLLIDSRKSRSVKSVEFLQNSRVLLGFLNRVRDIYGVGGTDSTKQTSSSKRDKLGWPDLQIAVLHECIAIAEGLPDYLSMLEATTMLLRTLHKHLSKEEQVRLAASIPRIVAAGQKAGQLDGTVPYWGTDLVQSVEPVKQISRRLPYAHRISKAAEDAVVKSDKKEDQDPFIYNPYSQAQTLLIANELAEFKVTLRNPFAFDIEVSRIILSASSDKLEVTPFSTIIPANGTTSVRLTGLPSSPGEIEILGCKITLAGCSEQHFQLPTPTVPSKNADDGERPSKRSSSGLQDAPVIPKPSNLPFPVTIIPEQPLLKVKKSSLLHSALMVFEGELSQVVITLENIGSVPVDFITLYFVDSTVNPALTNPDLPPEEEYERDIFKQQMTVFSWDGTHDERMNLIGKKVDIQPGQSYDITVSVLGKRGCTGGTIQIDYSYLHQNVHEDSTSAHDSHTFYSRQLYFPMLITVQRNLDVVNWDILYLRSSDYRSRESTEAGKAAQNDYKLEKYDASNILELTQYGHQRGENAYCLATVDIRNMWNVPFEIEIAIGAVEGNDNMHDSRTTSNGEASAVLSLTIIDPGCTRRIVLPIKRLCLPREDLCRPIPVLKANKQFVVQKGPPVSPAEEQRRLSAFWYREELLKMIKARWRCLSTGQNGLLYLRPSLRLTPLQLAILVHDDVEFNINMSSSSDDKVIQRLGYRHFQCPADQFIYFTIGVVNRKDVNVHYCLRIQPARSHNDGAKEYDLNEKLLYQGLLQTVFHNIPPSEEATYSLPVCFLTRGQYEFLYHIQDVQTGFVAYDRECVIVDVK